MAWTQEKHTWIEKNHLGDWSPEKDCCLWLTFRQPARKPSSESSDSQSVEIFNWLRLSLDSEDGFRTGCRNVSRKQQSFSWLQSPTWSFSIKISSILIKIRSRKFESWISFYWIWYGLVETEGKNNSLGRLKRDWSWSIVQKSGQCSYVCLESGNEEEDIWKINGICFNFTSLSSLNLPYPSLTCFTKLLLSDCQSIAQKLASAQQFTAVSKFRIKVPPNNGQSDWAWWPQRWLVPNQVSCKWDFHFFDYHE